MEKDTAIEQYGGTELAKADPTNATSIEVRNLIVGSAKERNLIVGSIDSLVSIVKNEPAKGVFWNEDGMAIVLADRSQMIRYDPELDPVTELFFSRARKKARNDGEGGSLLTWEGDYEPVIFKKADFLKWVRLHADQIPQEVVDNVKSLKIKMATNVSEDIIDEDLERKVEDTIQSTNVPKRFSMTLPLTENINGELDFECEITILRDQYDRPTGKRGVLLRCVNARQVKRDMMKGILSMLPDGIPQYYGRVAVDKSKDRSW